RAEHHGEGPELAVSNAGAWDFFRSGEFNDAHFPNDGVGRGFEVYLAMTDVLNLPASSAARPRFRPLKVIALAGSGASARHIQAAFEHEQFAVQIIDPLTVSASRPMTKPDLVVVETDLSDLGAGPAVERLIAGDLKGAPVLVFADALAP